MDNRQIYRLSSIAMMVLSAVSFIYQLITGKFTGVREQLQITASFPTILFLIYMLLCILIDAFSIYTGYLGYKYPKRRKVIAQCVRFATWIIIARVVHMILLEIGLRGIDFKIILGTLIGLILPCLIVYSGKAILATKPRRPA